MLSVASKEERPQDLKGLGYPMCQMFRSWTKAGVQRLLAGGDRAQAYKCSSPRTPSDPFRAQSQPLADAVGRVPSSLRVWSRRRAAAWLPGWPGRKDKRCARAGRKGSRLGIQEETEEKAAQRVGALLPPGDHRPRTAGPPGRSYPGRELGTLEPALR